MLATSEYPAGVWFLRWPTLTALGFVAGITATGAVGAKVAGAAFES